MKKISLQQLIDEDLLEIPEPDVVFTLGDVKGHNHLGLRDIGGYYVFKKDSKVIYVGVSSKLGRRMYSHCVGKGIGNLRGKLENIDKTPEQIAEYLQSVQVCIRFETSAYFQDVYEKYLIGKYKPRFNHKVTNKGRSWGGMTSDRKQELFKKASEMYLSGRTLHEIAKELHANNNTVSKILKEGGIHIRGGHPQKSKYDHKKIVSDCLTGMLPGEVANTHGCNVNTVYRVMGNYREQQLQAAK